MVDVRKYNSEHLRSLGEHYCVGKDSQLGSNQEESLALALKLTARGFLITLTMLFLFEIQNVLIY